MPSARVGKLHKNTFDYVVVGAGSSGCVVASRLSELKNVSVLLIEAGGNDDHPAISDPRAYVQLFESPLDWAYRTEPEAELNNRRIFWPRGKVLGGTSAMNATMYVRGHRSDFDHWASLGNTGWSYDEVLPYFLKSERNSRGASPWHGSEGPLDVTDPPAPHPFSLAFIEAAAELGHQRNADFNGARQDGAGLFQRTIREGMRCSTARAFIHPARSRENLHVLENAEAMQVIFDRRRATGVRYLREGVAHDVGAACEVILCGGTINSPQLLMLSGIGAAGDLKALGIDVISDLPGVGRNLQDHPMARFRCWSSSYRPVDATSNLVEAGLLCRVFPGVVAPDLYMHFLPVAMTETRHGVERAAFSVASVVLRPKSRGSLRLRSRESAVPPLIHAGYLTEREDLDLMVEALKIARSLAHTHAFKKIFAEEAAPGSDVVSDADLEQYLRESVDTLFHPVGTCRMGTDAQAVVDPCLRVHGVEALRVIDASIMPTITSGPTNAPAILIAEKGADMIKADRSAG